jgi:hypothetical protein
MIVDIRTKSERRPAFQGLSPWAFGPRKLMKNVSGYDSRGRER